MNLAPGSDGKTWVYGPSASIYPTDEDLLSRVLRGRNASARWVWASRELAWWVVRFEDGTESAVPVQHQGPIYVDGALLEERLYPAQIIFGDARVATGL